MGRICYIPFILMHLFFYFLSGLTAFGPSAHASSYDTYVAPVTGNTRSIGLAGSVVSFPDGYSASFVNPAGLSGMTGTGIDFGVDSNNLTDFVVNLNDPKQRSLNFPLTYSFGGARFASESGWGFGFLVQTPFQLNQTFVNETPTRLTKNTVILTPTASQDQIQLNDDAYTVAAAKSFFDKKFGIGMAINYHKVSQTFDFIPVQTASAPIHKEADNDAISVDVGLLGRPWDWLQWGLVYRSGYEIPFNSAQNAALPPGVNFFRNTRNPDRVNLGAAWIPYNNIRVMVQSNYVNSIRDTVIAGSGLFSGQSVRTGRYDTLDAHWGIEYIPIQYNDLTLKLWAGGYLENTGIEGSFTRYHRTAGFQFSPWFIDVSIADDDAQLYNNFAAGMDIDLLGLFSRLNKYYGWGWSI